MQKTALAALLTSAFDQGAVPSFQASVPAYASFSRSQYLRILHLSMSQYMRMYFHVSVHAYVFNFHASVHAYEFPCLSTCVCFSMPQCMRMQFLGLSAYVYHPEFHFEFAKLCYHFRFEGL